MRASSSKGTPRAPVLDPRERWRVDSERSALTFRVGHAVLPDIEGKFDCWGGAMLLDTTEPTRSSVRIWVDLSSLDTGSAERDQYILSTEPFDVRWEPAVVFDSERLEISDLSHGRVVGGLTIQACRQEISVTVEARDPPPQPDASGTAARRRYVARGALTRSAFGLRRTPRHVGDWLADKLLYDTIEFTAYIEATRDFRLEDAVTTPHVSSTSPAGETGPAL